MGAWPSASVDWTASAHARAGVATTVRAARRCALMVRRSVRRRAGMVLPPGATSRLEGDGAHGEPRRPPLDRGVDDLEADHLRERLLDGAAPLPAPGLG